MKGSILYSTFKFFFLLSIHFNLDHLEVLNIKLFNGNKYYRFCNWWLIFFFFILMILQCSQLI